MLLAALISFKAIFPFAVFLGFAIVAWIGLNYFASAKPRAEGDNAQTRQGPDFLTPVLASQRGARGAGGVERGSGRPPTLADDGGRCRRM